MSHDRPSRGASEGSGGATHRLPFQCLGKQNEKENNPPNSINALNYCAAPYPDHIIAVKTTSQRYAPPFGTSYCALSLMLVTHEGT